MSEPRERADRCRRLLNDAIDGSVGTDLLPPGSLVLTAGQAETVRKRLDAWIAYSEAMGWEMEADDEALALLSPESNVDSAREGA